jgi:hypothetical protein
MMQRKTWLLLGAGAAAMLTFGGLAGLAQADMEGGPGGGNCGMPRFHRLMPHGMMGQQMTERYDANKDGKVTQAEIDQNRQQWLAEFDADKNGTLSLDEFRQLWLKGRNEMMVREFQFFDRDGNGQVTIDEYKVPMAGFGDGPGEGRGWRHGRMRDHGMMGEGRGHCSGDGDGPGQPADAPDEEPGDEPATP